MSTWPQIFAALDNAVFAAFGQPITYSRPASTNFAAVAPFTITGAASSGGEYASPTGPLFAGILVRLNDIPLGPQKGDLLVPTVTTFSVIAGRTYKVDEIFSDGIEGTATLKVRWTGE